MVAIQKWLRRLDIDPEWQGRVQFHELFFGSWLSYIFLVLVFDGALRRQNCCLDEWQYLVVHLSGCSAYLINHYFQYSPFYHIENALGLMYLYTYAFCLLWFRLLVKPNSSSFDFRSKVLLTLAALPYSLLFIGFECMARMGVKMYGQTAEFGFVLSAFVGHGFLILWRGPITQTRMKALTKSRVA